MQSLLHAGPLAAGFSAMRGGGGSLALHDMPAVAKVTSRKSQRIDAHVNTAALAFGRVWRHP